MSIIPVHALSSGDLRLLGNNLDVGGKRPSVRDRHKRAQLAAINRSLAVVGEQVSKLRRPLIGGSIQMAAASA